jgi:hypothetical protein
MMIAFPCRRAARCFTAAIIVACVMSFGVPKSAYAGDCMVPEAATAAALFEDLNAALKTQHPDRIARLFATDGALRGFASPIARNGYMPIRDYFLYFLQFEPKARVTTRSVEMGCNFLIDQGEYVWTLKSRATGAVETREARYHFIYEMVGGRWRISQYVDELAAGAQIAAFAVPPPLVPRVPIVVAPGGTAVAGFVSRAVAAVAPPSQILRAKALPRKSSTDEDADVATLRSKTRAQKKTLPEPIQSFFEEVYIGDGGR